MSETTAKAVRVITLPPIMALFLILLLKESFPDGHDWMAIVLLPNCQRSRSARMLAACAEILAER